MLTRLIDGVKRARIVWRGLVVLALSALPWIVMKELVWLDFQQPISSFRPVLNDEVYYWHQDDSRY